MARNKKWYKLDNAAKIIPSTMQGADTRVFRISCELTEDVDPVLLQAVLDRTIQEFPHFNCVLRKGLFWYYLEESSKRAIVEEENKSPMSTIYSPGRKNLLFRLVYHKKRISLEMFHALADGTGGFTFFRSIVTHYLIQKYGLDESIAIQDKTSVQEKIEDAFSRFYERKPGKGKNWLKTKPPKHAFQIKGERNENLRLNIVEITSPIKKIIDAAHEEKATVAEFVTAVFVEAIIKEMQEREKKRPIIITVPVNLRNYFPSETTRNFFGVINVTFEPKKYDGTLQSIIPEIRREFEENLNIDRLFKDMNSYAALEHNWAVKAVPLLLKDLGVQGLHFLSRIGVTSSASNLGIIKMHPELMPYIDKFSCFMAAQRMQMCYCSFKDKMCFGVVTVFQTHNVMMNFARRLVELGIPVELATTDFDA